MLFKDITGVNLAHFLVTSTLKEKIMWIKNMYLISLFSLVSLSCQSQTKKEHTFPIHKTESEWKAALTPEQFYILRQKGTERAFTGEYNKFYKDGVYHCAACNNALYESTHKFDSGTGWPSFDRAVSNSVVTDTDYNLGYARSELLCSQCGGHLGHVFGDGPRETTGKRHCINSDALTFKSN